MTGRLNKFQGIGFLGQDVETRMTQNSNEVCNFSLGCTESWKDKNGQWQEKTEWIRAIKWKPSDSLKSAKKGTQLYIEGKLQTREWSDKNNEKRYVTEIICQTVQILDRQQQTQQNYQQPNDHGNYPPPNQSNNQRQPSNNDYLEDD